MHSAAERPIQPVSRTEDAGLLLHPLRQRILAEAMEPATAAEIARRVGLPPQKVNYHVRTLAEAGFLRPAGQGRKRNLIEKRYRASARSYVLLPRVLGQMSAAVPTEADRFSASHLMQLSARLQEELAEWLHPGAEAPVGVPTLSLDAELRFESAEQRAAFAEALQHAIADVVGRHTTPAQHDDGSPRAGRPYRLVVGCYPVPGRPDEPPPPTSDPQETGP